MRTPSRRHARVLLAVVLVLSAGAVLSSYARADSVETGGPATGYDDVAIPADDGVPREPVPETSPRSDGPDTTLDRSRLDDAGNLTVVATQGFFVSDEDAELVAFDRDGEVVFHDDSYRVYFDVDPVPGRKATVEYVAARHLKGEDCEVTPRCTYNVFRRVNLSTGADREVYGEVTPRIYSARWHDVDRVNDTHVAIADIEDDSVRVVNTTSDETTWRWHASEAYDRDQGGQEGDWTHVNDVEVLADGRIMASVRNMDQVVFLDPGAGVQDNWTLGTDDDHDTLYEQHNPDYIPPEHGGPAITVADSENGRVLEYQRVDPETDNATAGPDGEWRRAWGWQDARLQWPRDADRLPGDTTLVVDTHGDRVVEVAPNGTVVWSQTVGMPYDVERLGTGDESTGGRPTRAMNDRPSTSDDSALSALVGGDTAVTHPDRGIVGTLWTVLRSLAPSLLVNGLLFAGPSWLRFPDLVFGLVAVVTAAAWAGTELYWAGYRPLERLRSLSRRTLRR